MWPTWQHVKLFKMYLQCKWKAVCSSSVNTGRCSKQAICCFLIYSSLINIVHLKCSTMKNVCLKWGMGGNFLIYSWLICILCQKYFYYQFHQKFCEEMLFKLLLFILFSKLHKISANSCFLVYSSSFKKLPLTTAFDLT